MKPKRIWTVIFYISFLPYILGILWSIWNAATGIQMEGYVMYGISAFWTTIKLILLVFTLKIPLIQIVLLYEIFYKVLCKKMKEQNIKRAKKKKSKQQKQEIKYNL